VCENPVMTFPIMKRIITELSMDRMAALYTGFELGPIRELSLAD